MRRFGVELEHGNRQHDCYSIARHLTEKGLPCFYGGQHGAGDHRDKWSVTPDGSGLEVRTRPLPGDTGFAELRKGMRILRDAGGFVTRRDGMHVHFEAPDYHADDQAKERLAETWLNNVRHIHQFVDPYRRGQGYGRTIPDKHSTGRDYDLNLRGHNGITIELRLHEGTLEYQRAANWLRFGNYLLDTVIGMDDPIPPCQNVAEFLRQLRVPSRVRTYCLNWKPQYEGRGVIAGPAPY